MKSTGAIKIIITGIVFLLCSASFSLGGVTSHSEMRENASRFYQDGNYKDALGIYQTLALDGQNSPQQVGNDFYLVITCMNSLNRENETDDFREQVVSVHKNKWQLLLRVSQSWFNANHYGYIVAGEFKRGRHRGGGKYVNSFERDRIRALQLMKQAMEISRGEKDKNTLSDFYFEFARMLMGFRGFSEAWRLQYLSDLLTLPDYEDGYRYHSGRGGGAPVGLDGNPIFYRLPENFAAAENDGERWRFVLDQAAMLNPSQKNRKNIKFADFLNQQFGIHTMSYYEDFFRQENDGENKRESLFQLHTLSESETLAKLATGIKRLRLPDEFNYIKIYRSIADDTPDGYKEQALNALATIFENRRQYTKAAVFWKISLQKFGNKNYKQIKIDQIVNNWGRFEPTKTHPHDSPATIEFIFRNGKEVAFEAHKIQVKALLEDVKDYLKSNPGKLDWNRINIGNIGHMLIRENGKKYIGEKVTQWRLKLFPKENHFDERITIDTPLKNAGAYLLIARMKNGNTSRVVIWINDTVIVKKQLDKKAWFFVADAITGKPLSNMNVEFFGYRQERTKWEKYVGRHYNVLTTNFSEYTDNLGQVMPQTHDLEKNYQWLITAATTQGRLAFLGFSHIWYERFSDRVYHKKKTFVITDRPVYRPNQPVKFKFWVREAKYDQQGTSHFANKQFTVRITNPKNEKVFEEAFTSDAFGGIDGDYLLPKDSTLGVYAIQIPGHRGGTFRVEEYKKPEFEVKIDTPSEPVKLGDKITATVRADYYFGAKVTQAKVVYKVLRTPFNERWYPKGSWDWLYGRGYWWFSYDYDWYPGWQKWGCLRPSPFWWPKTRTPPEVVAEREVKMGEDGSILVEIDTALAKEIHGDQDHKYDIIAEVTDMSRRTIVGKGSVLAARKPFKVFAWVDRGHYQAGDIIHAEFSAQTLDSKPVKGNGFLALYKITWKMGEPKEAVVFTQDLDTDDEGHAKLRITVKESGQYRLLYKVTDSKRHTMEGGYLFNVIGDDLQEKGFRFNEIELIPDKREYAPNDLMRLMVNANSQNSTVLLFIRPVNGICHKPEILFLQGQSIIREIRILQKDRPNFFVEAFTVRNGRIYSDIKEIIVPPEKRVLNVDLTPSKLTYEPGEKASVKVKLTDFFGEPFEGSIAMSVFDRSVEYISGGSNIPEIREFFWKWRRRHHIKTESSLDRYFANLILPKEIGMQHIGIFGHVVTEEPTDAENRKPKKYRRIASFSESKKEGSFRLMAPVPVTESKEDALSETADQDWEAGSLEVEKEVVPIVRKTFADTAFWTASLTSGKDGTADVTFTMPENLTGWKIRTWAMGHGTVVGEGLAEVVTSKKLLLRLQSPRFFVEKDEVTLSANIHNYLEKEKKVRAVLELDGDSLTRLGSPSQKIIIPSGGEKRVDFRVKAGKEGESVIRIKALSDEASDAMEMRFPVYVHGMLKTDAYCGVIRKDKARSVFYIDVPLERRTEESRLEIRYSPTLAGAMVDALPFLANYPYGCTEQTLNRFLPTVITLNIINHLGIDLSELKHKKTNLNAQEIGDDKKRSSQWQTWDNNPVFDRDMVLDMTKKGLKRLAAMQLSDGGWGWFSGWGEKSYPHTTAYVVHGLQIAEKNNVAVVPGMLARGIAWLKGYQDKEVAKLKNSAQKKSPYKRHPDNMDAFVYMVLGDAGLKNREMGEFLYKDRNILSVYGKAMVGMALFQEGKKEKLDMVMQNIEQYLVRDTENQTAYLNLPNKSYWWNWYGSEFEAHAYYLKLLSHTDPLSEKAAGLVKYLLNNRRHATYWNATRDTALCIEAMADYLKNSGEDKPDMKVEIFMDGIKYKRVNINAQNLFTFDNTLVLSGKTITSGKHEIDIRRKGRGPLYYNAYLTNFTLEDFIKKAGLEIKINRKYYKLEKIDKHIKVKGQRGQAMDQKVEKYKRLPMENLSTLKSGDLVEIELEIQSKNDYEYIVIEDMKAAGLEPFRVRSGYNGNALSAYMELRDEQVCFFVSRLARGKHSLSYRMRAEIPGRFSALPAKAFAMYAPELKANSDEIKLNVID